MLASLGERGYKDLRARELCARAGVSTRDLYRHYKGGVHECFIACAEELMTGIRVEVTRAWRRGGDPQQRLSLAIDAFTRLVAAEPVAARVALCEPFTVGPCALRALRGVERRMQRAFLAECARLGRRPSPVAAHAMFAGLTEVARACLLAGREAELPALAGELTAWALQCLQTPALGLMERRFEPSVVRIIPSETAFAVPAGEHASERLRILAATSELVARSGYGALSESAICAAAHVSRDGFHEHFAEAHAAFVAALEMLWAAARSRSRARSRLSSAASS